MHIYIYMNVYMYTSDGVRYADARSSVGHRVRSVAKLMLEWYVGVFVLLRQRSKHPRAVVITPKAATSNFFFCACVCRCRACFLCLCVLCACDLLIGLQDSHEWGVVFSFSPVYCIFVWLVGGAFRRNVPHAKAYKFGSV